VRQWRRKRQEQCNGDEIWGSTPRKDSTSYPNRAVAQSQHPTGDHTFIYPLHNYMPEPRVCVFLSRSSRRLAAVLARAMVRTSRIKLGRYTSSSSSWPPLPEPFANPPPSLLAALTTCFQGFLAFSGRHMVVTPYYLIGRTRGQPVMT
jgi:hypothetical protein